MVHYTSKLEFLRLMVGFMEEEGEEEEAGRMEEGSSFLEMLGSGEEEGHLLCLLTSLNSSPSSAYSFGEDGEKKAFPLHGVPPRKSSDSSSPTSTTTSAPKPSKKKVDKLVTTRKKPKTEGYGAHGTAATTKVRKEKLGERIMALQQLVSPFGKTDTASVLHEALGYIRFLHDQVQVLSSPYLQRLPSSAHLQGELLILEVEGYAWSQYPAPNTWQTPMVLISGLQQLEAPNPPLSTRE